VLAIVSYNKGEKNMLTYSYGGKLELCSRQTKANDQPFKLLDFVGLGEPPAEGLLTADTTSYISEGWRDKAAKNPGTISEDLVKPSPLLEKMVKEGNLGRKSGKGFHDVSGRSSTVSRHDSRHDAQAVP